jgi:hypothetical protein
VRLPDPRERPWLTVAEVAEITGEGEKAIRAALDAGQLPLLEIGRYKRIPTARFYEVLGMSDRSVCTRPQHDAADRGAGSVRPALALARTEVDTA